MGQIYMPNEDIYWERVRERMEGDEPEEERKSIFFDDDEISDIESSKDMEMDEMSEYELEQVIREYGDVMGNIDDASWDGRNKCIDYTEIAA